MRSMLTRLDDRFRRLVASLRKNGLRRPGAGRIERGSREVTSSSLDLRSEHPVGRREFEKMAQRLGVELARLPLPLRDAMRDAERDCADCGNVRRCRRWLAQETADDPQLFCPNAPLFSVIAARLANAARRGR